MWGHYSNSHQGYCLEFELEENQLPHSRVDEILPLFRNNYGRIHFKPIEYVKNYDRINGFLSNPYFTEDTDENYLVADCIIKSMNRKFKHWKYESETRMSINEWMSPFSDDYIFKENRIYRYNILSLKGVLFGMKANRWDKERIIRIIKRKRFELLESAHGINKILPPIAFYNMRRNTPNYRLKRNIDTILDCKNKHRYHIKYDQVYNEYLDMKETGKHIEVKNNFDFGEWQLDQMKKKSPSSKR